MIDLHDPDEQEAVSFLSLCERLSYQVMEGQLPLIAVVHIAAHARTQQPLKLAATCVAVGMLAVFIRSREECATIH